MTKWKILYIIAFAALSTFGCTKDFAEINTNTNAHLNQFNRAYLRQVIYNFGENMSYEGFVAGDLLSHTEPRWL
jgi:hypothetical protein